MNGLNAMQLLKAVYIYTNFAIVYFSSISWKCHIWCSIFFISSDTDGVQRLENYAFIFVHPKCHARGSSQTLKGNISKIM